MLQRFSLLTLAVYCSGVIIQQIPQKPEAGKTLLVLKIIDRAAKKPITPKGMTDHPKISVIRESSTQAGGFLRGGEGVYAAADIEPGDVVIAVEYKGYVKWTSEKMTLEPDKKKEITVELSKGVNFSGKFKAEGDTKFRHVSIEFPKGFENTFLKVGSDETFSFKDLAPSVYKFVVTHKDFKKSSFWVKIGDSDIKDLEVKISKEEQKESSLTVNVSDDKTSDVIEKGTAIVTVATLTGPGDIGVSFAEGFFTIQIPQGKTRVKVSAAGYKSWEKEFETQGDQEVIGATLEK